MSTILHPLLNIAKEKRIALENTNRDIEKIQILLNDNPLQPCKCCSSSGGLSWCEKETPGETGQHLIWITCFDCYIQTIPENVFTSQPDSFYSAAYDAIEVWNGEVK